MRYSFNIINSIHHTGAHYHQTSTPKCSDMALGMDYGNAGNWAGNFVSDFYGLSPTLASTDYSQFVVTSDELGVRRGYGNVTSLRTFTDRGKTFRLANTYRLAETARFIQVDTTIINMGTDNIWNARLWTGTR